MGLTLFESGDYGVAAEHFKTAIKFESTAVHYNNRGLANFHAQDKVEALEDFNNALKLND